MKRTFNHYKKIIITFIVLVLAFAGGGYYYLYSTKLIQSNLNINKIISTNKIYDYTVYSDFYFRVYQYDGNKIVADYSEIQPIETSIGCIIKNKTLTPTLRSILGKKDILLDDDGTKVNKQITMMQSIEPVFGKIVATQDNDYLNASLKKTKAIFKDLYNINMNTIDFNESKLYKQINNLPIANMKIKYYKLAEIPKNIKGKIKISSKDKWEPNIFEIDFGENDKIYLQYLMQVSHINLNDYLKNQAAYKNKIIIKLIKINNNKLQTMYIIENNKNNEIKTLYMDANGYVYALIYKADNIESYQKYISDYLKLAYGIYFIDVKSFDNTYAKMQEKAIKRGKKIFHLVLQQEYLDDVLGSDLLNYFHVPIDSHSLYVMPSYVKKMRRLNIDYKIVHFAAFYNYYNNLFPTKNNIDVYKRNLKDKELLDAVIKKYSLFLDFRIGKYRLKKKCKNHQNIQCVQNLKNKDWL